MHTQPRIIAPDDGEQFLNLGAHVNIKLSADATGGAFALVEHIVPPGGGPPPHTHPETELLYILSGTFEVVVGSEQAEAGAGSVVYVPPDTVHTTRNIGARAGCQLSIYLPGGAEGFFREAGIPVTSSQSLPDFDQPASLAGVDVPRVLAIARKYGMDIRTDTPPQHDASVTSAV